MTTLAGDSAVSAVLGAVPRYSTNRRSPGVNAIRFAPDERNPAFARGPVTVVKRIEFRGPITDEALTAQDGKLHDEQVKYPTTHSGPVVESFRATALDQMIVASLDNACGSGGT